MKRLMDLYTCHTNSKKDKIKRGNRVIINDEGYFEGIYTEQENKPDSYIFGKVDNKSIKVYDMPLGYNETFVLQGSTQDYKYTGTYDLLIYGCKLVTKEAMAQTIMTLSDKVRLIFFNACFSAIQAENIVKYVDIAIGMNTSIGDEAALVFASQFYSSIGFGKSIEVSFNQAKAALMLEGIPEETTPELFVRDGLQANSINLVQPE